MNLGLWSKPFVVPQSGILRVRSKGRDGLHMFKPQPVLVNCSVPPWGMPGDQNDTSTK